MNVRRPRFDLKRGDVARLSREAGVPYQTVSDYVHGRSKTNYESAAKIDAAYAKLKPAKAARRAAKQSTSTTTAKEPAAQRRAAAPAPRKGAPGAARAVGQPAQSTRKHRTGAKSKRGGKTNG